MCNFRRVRSKTDAGGRRMTIKEAIEELRTVQYVKDDWLNSDKTNEAIELLLQKISNGYTLINSERYYKNIINKSFICKEEMNNPKRVVEITEVWKELTKEQYED